MPSSFANVLIGARPGVDPSTVRDDNPSPHPERLLAAQPQLDGLMRGPLGPSHLPESVEKPVHAPVDDKPPGPDGPSKSAFTVFEKERRWGIARSLGDDKPNKPADDKDDPWKPRPRPAVRDETKTAPEPDSGKTKGTPQPTSHGPETRNRRPGMDAKIAYGDYTPDLADQAGKGEKVKTASAHAGKQSQAEWGTDGEGGSRKTNLGAWTQKTEVSLGARLGTGAGARAEFANTWKTRAGDVSLKTNGLAGAEGSMGGKLSFRPDSVMVQAGAEGRIGLFGEAGAEYRIPAKIKIGGVPIDVSPSVGLTGRSFVGAEGGGNAKLGFRMVPDIKTGKVSPEASAELNGTAFAGAKAEGDASVGVGGNNAAVTGGALAGVGAEAKFGAGLRKNDKGRTVFKLEGKLAAALGVGASLGFKIELDVTPLIDAGKKIAAFFVGAAKKVKNTGKKVIDGIKDAGKTVIDGIKHVGEKIGNGVKNAAKKVGNFFKKLF